MKFNKKYLKKCIERMKTGFGVIEFYQLRSIQHNLIEIKKGETITCYDGGETDILDFYCLLHSLGCGIKMFPEIGIIFCAKEMVTNYHDNLDDNEKWMYDGILSEYGLI